MANLKVDLEYQPRAWQKKFHDGVARKQFGLCIVARQHGKSHAAVMEILHRALSGPPDTDYGFVSPYSSQGRKVAWPRLKLILNPLAKYCEYRETDLISTLPNGCRIHVLSADNEGARGLSLRGIVFDEFDSIKPDIFRAVFLPTLASFKDAFSIFIGTLKPNGRLWKLYQERKDDPDWYVQVTKASQAGCLTKEQLDRFELEMGRSHYLREFECDPHAPTEDAILGDLMDKAQQQGRIISIPVNPISSLYTAWDLGFRDYTAVWFFQFVGEHIHFFDYMEFTGIGLADIVHQIKQKYRNFDTAVLPHDASNHDVGSGLSRIEIFHELDLGYPEILPRHSPAESLHSARLNLSRCIFDKDRCALGVRRLRNVQYQKDARTDTILDRAIHNDDSHCFDAFRYAMHWIESRFPSNTLAQFNRPVFRPKVIKSFR